MINKVTLIGRLGQDPEMRHLENGASIAKLNLATNENYKDKEGNWQDRTEWHTVIAWRYLAERAEKTLKKGSLVYIEGKLSTRKWQDSEGKDRWTTEVVASNVRTLERRENTGVGGGGYPPMPSSSDEPFSGQSAAKSTASVTSQAVPTAAPTLQDAADDDLPF
ncbi:MAG: single-stranded DNA-binding protein [Bacteroidota bacterium]